VVLTSDNLNSFLRQSYLVSTNVTSALEFFVNAILTYLMQGKDYKQGIELTVFDFQ